MITNCPLCQSDSNFFLEADKREYRLCSTCELIFVPPEFFLSSTEERERYLLHENTLENEGYVNMFQEKIDLVEKHCSNIRTILDYGCGPGPVLQSLLSEKKYDVDIFDPFFFPETQLRDSYDLVISTETFEHFQNPEKELKTLTEKIRPGGYLAVMTRFYPTPEGHADPTAFNQWYYKREPTHIVFYGPKTISWIQQNFPLKIVYQNQKDFVILRATPGGNLPSRYR